MPQPLHSPQSRSESDSLRNQQPLPTDLSSKSSKVSKKHRKKNASSDQESSDSKLYFGNVTPTVGGESGPKKEPTRHAATPSTDGDEVPKLTGLFGSKPYSSSTSTPGGVFGGLSGGNTKPMSFGPSAFGSESALPSQSSAPGSAFGKAAVGTPEATTSSTGLFGSKPTSSPFGNPAFGSSKPSTSGNLFGKAAVGTPEATTSSTGLFGSKPSAENTSTKSSAVFGGVKPPLLFGSPVPTTNVSSGFAGMSGDTFK